MYIMEQYARKRKFKRDGLLSSLTLPKGVKLEKSKNDIKINVKLKSIDIIVGKHSYALTNKFGVSELSEFTLFFMNDFMVIELQKGYLYLEEGDKIFVLDTKSNIKEFQGDLCRVHWETFDTILKYCKEFTANKYHLIKNEDIKNYVSNLLYTFKSSYEYNNSKLYTLKLVEMYCDLGIDIFNYEVKEDKKVDKNSEVKVKSNFKEEAYINELERNALIRVKKNKNLSDSEESDDDFEDIEVLPSHMHEIDIFNEYTSETSEDY